MKITKKAPDNIFIERMDPSRHHEIENKPKEDTKRLHEIADVNPEKRQVKKNDYINPDKMIELESVDRKTGKILFSEDINQNKDKSKYKLFAKKDDILFPKIFSKNTGPVLVQEDKTFLIADYFNVLVPNKKVNSYYLTWALQHAYSREQIERFTVGSYGKKINLRSLKKIKIIWLEKGKREEIAQKTKQKLKKKTYKEKGDSNVKKINYLFQEHFNLDKKLLESNNYLCYPYAKFESMENWRLKRVLTPDLNEIIKRNEKILTLADVASHIDNGLAYREIKDIDDSKLLKGKDLVPLYIKKQNNRNKVSNKDKCVVQEDDILIRIKSKVGITALVTKKQTGLNFYNDLARIKVDDKVIYSKYLVIYLNSFIAQKYFKDYQKDKTMKYINISNLKQIPIIVPKIEEQKEIIRTLNIKKIK